MERDYGIVSTTPGEFREVIVNSNSRFFGRFDRNLQIGPGELITSNSKVIGHFKEFELNGSAIKEDSSGKMIQGTFNQGRLNGYAKISDPSNSYKLIGFIDGVGVLDHHKIHYSGELRGGLKSGIGQLREIDGITYTGEFQSDIQDGFGIVEGHYPGSYSGQFKKGKRNGIGLIKTEKFSYIGQFEDGLYSGFGFFKSEDIIIIGNWTNNKQSGLGFFENTRLGLKYFGEWNAGVREGPGVEITQNHIYYGDFIRGQRYGEGLLISDNQSSYIRYLGSGSMELVNSKINSIDKLKEKLNVNEFLDLSRPKIEKMKEIIKEKTNEIRRMYSLLDFDFSENEARLGRSINQIESIIAYQRKLESSRKERLYSDINTFESEGTLLQQSSIIFKNCNLFGNRNSGETLIDFEEEEKESLSIYQSSSMSSTNEIPKVDPDIFYKQASPSKVSLSGLQSIYHDVLKSIEISNNKSFISRRPLKDKREEKIERIEFKEFEDQENQLQNITYRQFDRAKRAATLTIAARIFSHQLQDQKQKNNHEQIALIQNDKNIEELIKPQISERTTGNLRVEDSNKLQSSKNDAGSPPLKSNVLKDKRNELKESKMRIKNVNILNATQHLTRDKVSSRRTTINPQRAASKPIRPATSRPLSMRRQLRAPLSTRLRVKL